MGELGVLAAQPMVLSTADSVARSLALLAATPAALPPAAPTPAPPIRSSSTNTCLAWAWRQELVQASRMTFAKAAPAFPGTSSPLTSTSTPTSAKASTTASSSAWALEPESRRRSAMTVERSRSSSATDSGSVRPISR